MAVHTYLQSIEKARRGRRERKASSLSDGGGGGGGLQRERGDEEQVNGPGEATECGPARLAAGAGAAAVICHPHAASDPTWTDALVCHECKIGNSISLLFVTCQIRIGSH